LAYWEWCKHKYLPILERLGADARILELGCGPGHMVEFLTRSGFTRVSGIDVSEEQIEMAKKRGINAQVIEASEMLSGTENSWDAIIAIDLVEHFYRDELLGFFTNIYNGLKCGGMLIIQTPNGQGLFPHQVIYGDLTHLTIFTPSSLKQILRLVGFEEIHFKETGPVPNRLLGKIRLLLWTLIKFSANTVRRIEAGKAQDIWSENIICYCHKPHQAS